MSILADVKMLWLLARGLHGFLRHTISLEDAQAIVRQRMSNRESNFLHMVEHNIFGHTASPYLSLLNMAGCKFGDLRELVIKEGVEGALSRLIESGVYLTFDEFKGRKEVIRGSQRFTFTEEDFDNPNLPPHFKLQSGATRGRGTSVKFGLSFILDQAVNTALSLYVHGLLSYKPVIWLLPTGWLFMLRYAKSGLEPIAWFYPMKPPSLTLKAGSRLFATFSRLQGRFFPMPELFDLKDTDRMAEWLAGHLKDGKKICFTCYASSAVRISSSAKQKGIPLDGVTFITIGEPFTRAKQRIIEDSGARGIVQFGFTEAGFVGYSCGKPSSPDDVHFFKDNFGLVQRSREVGETGFSVQAFLFTSLLSSAPKILLNVESGDYGIVEQKRCGCMFESFGLQDHISRIRSFEKLSSEGMTFVQTDLLRILENVLPSRFGGTGADFQVIEEEGEKGIQRVYLIVSPRIGPVDTAEIRKIFLEELAKDGMFGRIGAKVWQRAETVEVRREWPVATKAGKILPFHIIKA